MGQVQNMGMLRWQKLLRRCVFPMASTKGFGYLLSTYADTPTGTRINPGRARLAREYGVSERQVSKHLEALQRFGMVLCEVQGNSFGRGGKGLAARYRLTAPVVLVDTASGSADDVMLVLQEIFPTAEVGNWSSLLTEEVENPDSPLTSEVENYSPELGNLSAELENSSAESGELQFNPSTQGSAQGYLPKQSLSEDLVSYFCSQAQAHHGVEPRPTARWTAIATQLLQANTLEDIKNVIQYGLEDSFWADKILTFPKLEKHFDQLKVKAKNKAKAAAESGWGTPANKSNIPPAYEYANWGTKPSVPSNWADPKNLWGEETA